jgi:hypothetical protein
MMLDYIFSKIQTSKLFSFEIPFICSSKDIDGCKNIIVSHLMYFLLILLVLANLQKTICVWLEKYEIAVKWKINMKYSAVYPLRFELGLALSVSIDLR